LGEDYQYVLTMSKEAFKASAEVVRAMNAAIM
jgi:hypothetical protein